MNNERKILMTENIYEPTEYNYDPYDLCECYEPIVEPQTTSSHTIHKKIGIAVQKLERVLIS